jgi:hypothetical protein
MDHSLPEQPAHLKWKLHLLLISVYQRSLAVYYFQNRERLPRANRLEKPRITRITGEGAEKGEVPASLVLSLLP